MDKDLENNSIEMPKEDSNNNKATIWELLKFTLIAILIIVPFRMFIAQPFIVHGSSMDPTFKNGDYLIIDEISYRFKEPQKDDIIVFKFPQDPSKFFIKRIVGIPGETIDIENKKTILKENEYFVMGDNRPVSSDSRRWGPVKKDLIVGRAILRLLPISEIDILPGKEPLK